MQDIHAKSLETLLKNFSKLLIKISIIMCFYNNSLDIIMVITTELLLLLNNCYY